MAVQVYQWGQNTTIGSQSGIIQNTVSAEGTLNANGTDGNNFV